MPRELMQFAQTHGLTPEQAEAIQNIVDETGMSLEDAMELWIPQE